jgi:hypothetical protein
VEKVKRFGAGVSKLHFDILIAQKSLARVEDLMLAVVDAIAEVNIALVDRQAQNSGAFK